MAFPSSPVNSQTATVGGITYTYASATNSWTRNATSLGNIVTVNLDGNGSNILYGNGSFSGAPVSYANSNVAAYLPTYTGNITAGNIMVASDLYVGTGANATGLSNPTIIAKDAAATYIQIGAVNSSNAGSADFAAYGDNGTDASGWVDMGFTGSNFSDANYTVTGKNDGYVFANAVTGAGLGGNLVFATGTGGTTNDIVFATGGFLSGNIKARLYNGNGVLSVTNGFTTTGTVNFTTASNVSLGSNANIKITGGSSGQVLSTDGAGNLSWATGGAGGGATITNETASGSAYYPIISTTTSGTLSAANVSTTKLYFYPTNGTLNATIFNSLSDETVKTDKERILNALEKLSTLGGYTYMLVDSNEPSAGLLAQQVQKILPEAVKFNPETGLLSLNYNGVMGLVVEAINELEQRVTRIENVR
jgi:hypothetical protein